MPSPSARQALYSKYATGQPVFSDADQTVYLSDGDEYTISLNTNKNFAKSRLNIVERLANQMMRTERYTGKKSKSLKLRLQSRPCGPRKLAERHVEEKKRQKHVLV